MNFNYLMDKVRDFRHQIQMKLLLLKVAIGKDQASDPRVQVQKAWEIISRDPKYFLNSESLTFWLQYGNRDPNKTRIPIENTEMSLYLAKILPKEFIESAHGPHILAALTMNSETRNIGVEMTRLLIEGLGPHQAVRNEAILGNVAYASLGDEDGSGYAMLIVLGVNDPDFCRESEEYRKACSYQFEFRDRLPPIDLGEETMEAIGLHLDRAQNAQHLVGKLYGMVGTNRFGSQIVGLAERMADLQIGHSRPQIR